MQSAPGDLPDGWQAAFDSRYQRYYYMHPASGVSQWEHPTQQHPQQANAAAHPAGEPAVISADAGHKARAAADTAAPSTQQQQQQQRVTLQPMYHYYDPWGHLMGPFNISQLTAWRPFLPMDLQLIPSQQAAADNASGVPAEPSDSALAAVLPLADESGCCKETDAAVGAAAAGAVAVQPSMQDTVEQTVQKPPTDPAAAQDSHKAGGSPCEALAAAADSRAPEATAAAAEAAGAACSQSQPADQAAADPGAATAAAGSVVAVAAASADTAAAAAAVAGSTDAMQPKAAAVYLADLLGDADLLKHFQQSQKQQQQQQQEQTQQQPDVQGPPRAAAPPAPVWQAWVAQHSSTAAAAPTAAASWHQQQQRQQDLPNSMFTVPAANFSSSSSGKDQNRSSFDKYAAAVLQGLPPEDEAVQLARVAAVHGYSLSQVLQPQQMNGALTSGVALGGIPGDGLPGGLTITAQGVTAMMVKDPRSGRLSVAAGGSSGGSSAAELYVDLARWCDPASLERTLHKKRQQEQLQPGKAVVVNPAGSCGAAKRTRLITG